MLQNLGLDYQFGAGNTYVPQVSTISSYRNNAIDPFALYAATSPLKASWGGMYPFMGHSTSNMFTNLLTLLSKYLGFGGEDVVVQDEIVSPSSSAVPEVINASSRAWGDPHFDLLGKRSFDFIGKKGGEYNLIDNNDISINASFVGDSKKLGIYDRDIKTVIGEENITFKGTGINIVARNNKQFDIYKNGEKIADQSNYKEVEKELAQKGIKINQAEKKQSKFEFLNLEFKGRKMSIGGTHGGMMNNIDLRKGDKGLQAQTVGALDLDDNKLDGKTVGQVDANGDGKVDEKDVIEYNVNDQVFLHTVYAKNQTVKISEKNIEAIKRDIKSGKGSIASRFTGEGYTAAQWNEFIGHKLFATDDKFLN